MENLLGEMMLGGLGIVIVILSFTRWTRDRAVTLGIGGWFLALALALVFEKALLFTILQGSRSAWLPLWRERCRLRLLQRERRVELAGF